MDNPFTDAEWQVTATTIHPALTFSSSGAQDTASLCIGVCVANSLRGTTPVEHFSFDNGAQRIELEWLLPDGVTIPEQLADFGSIYLPGSWLRWRYVPNVTNDFVGFQMVALSEP